MKDIIKSILRFILPHGIFLQREKMQRKKRLFERQERIKKFNENINSRLDYDYELSIQKLIDQDVSEQQIREGSIPESSLDHLFDILKERLTKLTTIKALHIGNFVGISLLYLSNALSKINSNSILISIDPNIPHRGITNPLKHVYYLLNIFGFQKSNIILTGYTLEENIIDDGGTLYFSSITNNLIDNQDYTTTHLLESLVKTNIYFDFILVDGNHDGKYLEREIKLVDKLLYKNGILVLDDINEGWEEVKYVYKKILLNPAYKLLADDNRLGIIEKVI
jgi:predicted O-methyltransferase YrrM